MAFCIQIHINIKNVRNGSALTGLVAHKGLVALSGLVANSCDLANGGKEQGRFEDSWASFPFQMVV